MTREEINILQDIVDIYEKEDMYPLLKDKQIRTIKLAIKALEQEPKPKTGKWTITTDCEGKTRKCTCNRCGYETDEYTWDNPNFCPNCGSAMKEGKHICVW